jgi:integrase
MSYIEQRQDRFYVVAYDGLDPLTGRERRRWHPVGRDRDDAEAVAQRLEREHHGSPPPIGGATTLGTFLCQTWLPRKRRQVRATTAYRYAWFVERYVSPIIGDVPLRRLRADHLEDLYHQLATTGGRRGDGLAPKTILEVHMIIRAALDLAVQRELIDRNVAASTQLRLPRAGRTTARAWTAPELATFLAAARRHRLYPTLHLAAHTGMRRGEVVGLKWSDLDTSTRRLSIQRTLQCVGGRPVEFGIKTRHSRRCIDLDTTTVDVLQALAPPAPPRWPSRCVDDWMFCNATGRFLNPESLSQLFDRIVQRAPVPRIRFHDVRHTHASLLIAAGVPIKVVSERLGHAHPAFTMHTYQHVLPGMGAAAADQFAALVTAASW